MIDQSEIEKYPIYGTSYNDACIWKIIGDNNTCSICIQDFSWISILYNYNTEANTIREESARLITRKEFYKLVKEIKEKYKINFTIK